MLVVKLDPEEPTDPHEQVSAEIRRAIADGDAKPGERLRTRRFARRQGYERDELIRFIGGLPSPEGLALVDHQPPPVRELVLDDADAVIREAWRRVRSARERGAGPRRQVLLLSF